MKVGPKIRPEADRFWAKVQRGDPDECWLWTGGSKPQGYGVFRDGEQRLSSAHRTSWRLANGPIPDGLLVCHRCDNPPCVNPDHLFLGSAKDNSEDMLKKGRRPYLRNRAILTKEQVLDARRRRALGDTCKQLAAEMGVHPSTISAATSGQNWRYIEG